MCQIQLISHTCAAKVYSLGKKCYLKEVRLLLTFFCNLLCVSFYDFVMYFSASGNNSAEPAQPVASEDIVSQLASMGFNYLHCQKAAINTSNTGVEEAMNWLLSHMDDPGWYANYFSS